MHDWDNVAAEWRETRPQVLWRAFSDALHEALLSCWLPEARVERLLKTDLFDEAFGGGLYGFLGSRAREVLAIDISPTVVLTAAERYEGLPAAAADVRYLPFADGMFDVVVSTSTLDHFPARKEIFASLREFRRILRSGGELLLTLDNPANPLVALRNATPFELWRRVGIVPYPVGSTLGRRCLRRALGELNFDIVEDTTFMHCPRVLAVAGARLLERYSGEKTQKRFLGALWAFERLSQWPTRFLTGYFIAVKAVKR